MNVATYLLDELARRGVRHLFGVPGDYNLPLLEIVLAHGKLAWVGNVNELNAAFAADGYARTTGLAAVALTYGVGELSAINGVAGSCSENVPVVVIASAPSREQIRSGAPMHHGLADGDWAHFLRAYTEVTAAQAVLSPENAIEEIDRVLAVAETERRPVYIAIPSDVPGLPVVRNTPIAVPPTLLDSGPIQVEFLVAAHDLVARARRPVILLGHEAARFGVAELVQHLAATAGIPVAITPMAKGAVDEQAVPWLGLYNGAASDDEVRAAVEDADLLVRIGTRLSHLETAGFTARFDERRVIDLRPAHSTVGTVRFAPLPLRQALIGLTDLFTSIGGPLDHTAQTCRQETTGLPPVETSAPLTQAVLWPALTAALQPGDTVITSSGTSFWGMLDQPLPSGVTFVAAPHWGSIGGSLPAALGVGLAAPLRRIVLVIGDGALQLTVQELATIERWQIPLTLVVVANDGYTIERVIDGPAAIYNDIAQWDHLAVVRAMAGAEVSGTTARTAGELLEVLEHWQYRDRRLHVLEVRTAPLDVPSRLRTFIETLAAQRRSASA
ncbi:alpha-keto acid decarboxylase family protein [Nocardia altamirensis]|uniref:alpha-keto acid decarboxylase family protein n=1 Tax=Nocardia altamirensis TaxID=472158 RepID=UPI000A4F5382|nr:thiamine pyrophosphate-binding protein [Nocardia altamirensis]